MLIMIGKLISVVTFKDSVGLTNPKKQEKVVKTNKRKKAFCVSINLL
jgi:pyruvate/oxaloacetate carboxyltransferase